MIANKDSKHVRKNSILLYGDYVDLIDRLSLTERGKLFTAILQFTREDGGQGAQKPSFNNRATELVYTVIANQLLRDRDRYIERCELNRELAKRRWSKKNASGSVGECAEMPSVCQSMPNDASRCQYDTDTDTDDDNDNDNDNDIDNDNEKGGLPPFNPPYADAPGGHRRQKSAEEWYFPQGTSSIGGETNPKDCSDYRILYGDVGANCAKETKRSANVGKTSQTSILRRERRRQRELIAAEQAASRSFDPETILQRALERSYGKKDIGQKSEEGGGA